MNGNYVMGPLSFLSVFPNYWAVVKVLPLLVLLWPHSIRKVEGASLLLGKGGRLPPIISADPTWWEGGHSTFQQAWESQFPAWPSLTPRQWRREEPLKCRVTALQGWQFGSPLSRGCHGWGEAIVSEVFGWSYCLKLFVLSCPFPGPLARESWLFLLYFFWGWGDLSALWCFWVVNLEMSAPSVGYVRQKENPGY